MSNDWVSVAEYHNSLDADLAKAELELEDIECQVTGDYENRALPAMGVMGPVRVLVRESDVARAREVLQGNEEATAQDS